MPKLADRGCTSTIDSIFCFLKQAITSLLTDAKTHILKQNNPDIAHPKNVICAGEECSNKYKLQVKICYVGNRFKKSLATKF